MSPRPDESAAATEFDTWASSGRAESMARHHRPATAEAIRDWVVGPNDVVLDVGCGNGWAVRWLLEEGAGRGIGVDIAPEMIARARAAAGDARARFEVASGQALPIADGEVSHILSVESLYYYPDPAAALAEWARVARPGARLALMLDLYAENPVAEVWADRLPIGVHNLSESQWLTLLSEAGWREPAARRALETSPPETEATFKPDAWTPSFAHYQGRRAAGSLVLTARR